MGVISEMSDTTPSFYKFIAAVKTQGVARRNRYVVDIIPPTHPRMSDVRRTVQLTSLYCHKAFLPAININTLPYKIFNEERQVPYKREFGKFALTFYVDNDLKIKKFFDRWINCIVNPETRTISYYNSYIGTMNIRTVQVQQENVVADEWGVVRQATDVYPYTIEMYEVYPTSIEAVSLDANSTDEMELSVNFNYKYYKVIPDDLQTSRNVVPIPAKSTAEPQSPLAAVASLSPAPQSLNISGQSTVLPDGAGMSSALPYEPAISSSSQEVGDW